jgi:hypothetical protein
MTPFVLCGGDRHQRNLTDGNVSLPINGFRFFLGETNPSRCPTVRAIWGSPAVHKCHRWHLSFGDSLLPTMLKSRCALLFGSHVVDWITVAMPSPQMITKMWRPKQGRKCSCTIRHRNTSTFLSQFITRNTATATSSANTISSCLINKQASQLQLSISW